MALNTVKIRGFKESDFTQVLDFLNENLEFDSISSEILNEKLYKDPNFDINNVHIAEINNRIVGFIQGVIRDIKDLRYGYVKLFAVNKTSRRQGIGTKLYNKFYEYSLLQNVNIIRVYDVPLNYFMPGIDPRYTAGLCFFERLGFKKFDETCNLKVDLQKQDWVKTGDIDKFKNIIIKRAESHDTDELFDFIKTEWKLWKHEIQIAMSSNPPAVFIARIEGKIKAFSAYNGNNLGTAWFGPMGTHPDLRGKGTGGILLKLCLQDMKDQGFKYSTIPWVGPISFYSHYAGAVVERVFWRYQYHVK